MLKFVLFLLHGEIKVQIPPPSESSFLKILGLPNNNHGYLNIGVNSTRHDAFLHDYRPMRQNAKFRHIFQTFHAHISIINAHFSMKIDQNNV